MRAFRSLLATAMILALTPIPVRADFHSHSTPQPMDLIHSQPLNATLKLVPIDQEGETLFNFQLCEQIQFSVNCRELLNQPLTQAELNAFTDLLHQNTTTQLKWAQGQMAAVLIGAAALAAVIVFVAPTVIERRISLPDMIKLATWKGRWRFLQYSFEMYPVPAAAATLGAFVATVIPLGRGIEVHGDTLRYKGVLKSLEQGGLAALNHLELDPRGFRALLKVWQTSLDQFTLTRAIPRAPVKAGYTGSLPPQY